VYFNRNTPHTIHKRHGPDHQPQMKMQSPSKASIRSTFGNEIHQQSCAVTPKLGCVVCNLYKLLKGVSNSTSSAERFGKWAAKMNINGGFASSAFIVVTFRTQHLYSPVSKYAKMFRVS
jgi:hypothetical protein